MAGGVLERFDVALLFEPGKVLIDSGGLGSEETSEFADGLEADDSSRHYFHVGVLAVENVGQEFKCPIRPIPEHFRGLGHTVGVGIAVLRCTGGR